MSTSTLTLLCLCLIHFLLDAPLQVCAEKTMAGYKPTSNVLNRARIDLDQEKIEQFTDENKWDEAEKIYTEGESSKKPDGSFRTLAAFSTSGPDKLRNEGYWELFKNYWNDDKYGNTFVMDALKGDGDFSNKNESFRGECANKGSQYQNVWMYVIHEMEDAINDCKNDNLDDNDGKAQAWDEAVAFYVGSKVGSELTDSVEGYLLYSLAQNRCPDFGTCDGGETGKEGVAKVNKKVMDLFAEGKGQLENKKCDDVITTKNNIVKQMSIPLVQGILRYIKATNDAKNANNVGLDKAHGEGWAFTAAVLPIINHCSENVAETLEDNFKPKASPPLGSGPEGLSKQLMSVFSCMGFKCDDVRREDGVGDVEGLAKCDAGSEEFKIVPGTDVASQENSSGLSGAAIAGIIIALLLVMAVVVFILVRRKGARKVRAQPIPGEGDMDDTFA